MQLIRKMLMLRTYFANLLKSDDANVLGPTINYLKHLNRSFVNYNRHYEMTDTLITTFAECGATMG